MTHPVRATHVLLVLSVNSFEVCGTSGSSPGSGDGRL